MNVFDIIFLIIFFLSEFVLFLFGVHYFIVIRIYQKNKEKYRKLNKKPLIEEYPKVTVQIPIYNEKFVVENLIMNITKLEYPKEKLQIQILDDSIDETISIVNNLIKKLSIEGINISHVVRNNRSGYKAGALNNGLELAEGDFIAIFDADFIPKHDFLLETVPFFIENEKKEVC